MNTTFTVCPNCMCDKDPIFKNTMWACGTPFYNPKLRTKTCYRNEARKIKNDLTKLETVN